MNNKPKTKEQSKLYKLQLVWFRIRHGLIIFSFLNLLQRLGIEINPYWIDIEGLDLCEKPRLRDDIKLYNIKEIDKITILNLSNQLGWNTSKLEDRFQSYYRGIGLFKKEKLTAFMLIRYNSFFFKNNLISLKENEAYLENMYTYENFRGKNLAPYLRYKSYELLAKEGKTRCFSITQYYNKSSRKFKSKLNAAPHEFWLQVGVLKKYRWNFLLKKYSL